MARARTALAWWLMLAGCGRTELYGALRGGSEAGDAGDDGDVPSGPVDCDKVDFLFVIAVVVTDEWDGPGDPEGSGSWSGPDLWTAGLLAAKGSDQNYVLAMLVNEQRGQCPPGHIEHDGHVLAEYAEEQPFGFVGSVCGDYNATFSQAIDVVAAACAGE